MPPKTTFWLMGIIVAFFGGRVKAKKAVHGNQFSNN
jgi:hypothetical protein